MAPDFLEFARYTDYTDNDGNKQRLMSYLIFVSKKFFIDAPKKLYDNEYGYKYNIIRNDLGFYPQFHYLEKMDGNSIDNYTINSYEAVCCAAELNNGYKVEDFRYGHMITEAEWTFFNHLTNETIKHPETSRRPFAAKSSNDIMNPGYYDVVFKYSLTDGTTNECRLDSAFRIK
jgi:hypothetical protein